MNAIKESCFIPKIVKIGMIWDAFDEYARMGSADAMLKLIGEAVVARLSEMGEVLQ